ncbi:transcriptional regulator [Methylovorus sp. MM2]|uniref:ArsR/SmtB family transcription factor n=1 Tax=Methylovorus sp. MM2 TaxID=1848038 RepID=UPI0007E0105A|nr:ArsR family transcriptional regulator [Methylovorus sp. MM2]OAM52046.1 transcriptional regulator [Methylovorus sp. MM2]
MKTIETIPSDWSGTSKIFVALGDEQRQRILLAFEPNERMHITQIVAASTLSRSAVTYHLNVLRDSGILQSEKVGKEVFFWINKALMATALKSVLNYVETEI